MSRLIESTIRGRPCLSACLWVMVATLMAVHGHAAAADFNATWNASSGLLPDAVCPGWVLTDTASPEEPTISNGRLLITTSANGENIFYEQSGSDISVPGLMIIEARLRFVSGTTSHVARTPAVVRFTVAPTVGNALFIGVDEVFLLAADLVRGASAAVDTDDVFHTYRLEVNTSTGAIDVFYDGTFLLSGTTFSDVNSNGSVASVLFGEGSSLATGTTEWEFVRHNASAVTCPCSSTVVTIAGLRAEVETLNTSPATIAVLQSTLNNVQTALDNGNNETARTRLANFVDRLVNRSNFASTNPNHILLAEANSLVCGTANVLKSIPLE